MLVLLLPIAAVLVFGTAYLVVSLLPPDSRVGRWLALWVAVWVEVVLTAEVLSLLDAVTPAGFLVCYVSFAAIAVAVWLKRGRPRTRLLRLPTRRQIVQAARSHPAIAVLVVVLGVCALVNVVVAVVVPVNNWDAMSYNLTRVGYWIQHGSTDHFFTQDERQNASPPNAEFGVLSLIIFTRAEWPAALPQAVAYLACIAAVYLLARQMGASNAAALFAALLLATMTEMVLQATIPKNALVVSSLAAASLAFLFRALSRGQLDEGDARGWRQALVWSALALGLTVGTKATAAFILPGIAVAAVLAVLAGGRASERGGAFRRAVVWAACCAAAVVLLGAFGYARNYAALGGLSGSPGREEYHAIAHPSFRATTSNLARYTYFQCDFAGLMPRSLARTLTRARARLAPPVFRALHVPLNDPNLNLLSRTNLFPVEQKGTLFDARTDLNEDLSWFGPISFFVGVPLVLIALARLPWRWRTIGSSLALAAAIYWLMHCALMRYSPWRGRYFVTAAVIAAPLLAQLYRPGRWPRLRHGVTWLLVIVGAMTTVTATFCNVLKPLYPKPDVAAMRHRGPFGVDYAALDALLSSRFDRTARVGLVLERGAWEWPLFGPRLERTLVHLPRDPERIVRALEKGEVDVAVISRARAWARPLDEMPPVPGEHPPLLDEPTGRVDAEILRAASNKWNLLTASDTDARVFYPTRDWTPTTELLFGAEQRFVSGSPDPGDTVVIELEVVEPLRDEHLTVDVFAGEALVATSTLTGPGVHTLAPEWPDLDEAGALRIVVRGADSDADRKLRTVEHVYRLRRLPHVDAQPRDRREGE